MAALGSPGGGGLADVFISYARSDEAVARRLAKTLEAAGIDVWWDADLPAHRAYSEVIERNLAEAKAVIVLWSKTAAGSQWVRAEADFARNAGKLVQAQLDGTLPPMPFNQIQCADLQSWRGGPKHSGWLKVQASVTALVTGEEPPTVSVQPRASERLHKFRWYAVAALVLLVVAGVWLFALSGPRERQPVLAVLPFRSLDARDASLVAGIWEDTRTAIGRNPQLVVLGPNTAQQLATKGPGAVRKAADYLLEASVRTAGDQIRVSADLVRTKDGEQVWSQDFDRKLDDVFALQSQIAGEIEGRIRGRLAEKGGVRPEHIATTGEVYALYSDARAKIRKRDPDLMVAAQQQLEQVVRMDPNFGPGWAALSEAEWFALPSRTQRYSLDRSAEQHARRAIDLAPNLAKAHATLALALELKGPIARSEVERAVQLDPNDAEALMWLGIMRGADGDKKGALDAVSQAVEIEPLFWPAVLNKFDLLEGLADQAGVNELIQKERALGAEHLVAALEMERAARSGRLAEAVNIALTQWTKGGPEAQQVISPGLWSVLLQLGSRDEAFKIGPAPDFAPYLWRDDPKGLDLLESKHVTAQAFFKWEPLTENAGRVYLLTGRSKKLADFYLGLHASPKEFFSLATGDSPGHCYCVVPLVAIALRENGHAEEAAAMLAFAEQTANGALPAGAPLSSSAPAAPLCSTPRCCAPKCDAIENRT